ncbi:radical SAM family heme chaperone HemW [Capnocytophaga catalasegens]|uniref:Heme chaperone HemW n=1 Tax=Capnocytophaga catalasegens TaxID=1004260 RepID=A0AAV5AYR2_9FLAO|nr:radical SAM family heme chaperone HemW [Capnocytophaga catalasegens]GIZ16064.1 coproporphyrinogen III oxidase [Capnocytophaga catalasegens]GJM50223.1 coproporphyrinogen III oxidase [Capnocytophaga catalasegens]GJM53454.1 coproporphyrinogen III oxidase [Capnocytophaga catalasegens]
MYSLYIHIPFCKQACHYCDFHFSTTLKRKTELIEALCKELILRRQEAVHSELQTIYFGGGTPSLLTSNELEKIMDTIYQHYKVSEKAEITLEANPDDFSNQGNLSLSFEKIKQLKINRLSIGIQSFFEEDLQLMNRAHTAWQAQTILQEASTFFDNITIDLIYGIPNMSNDRWIKNIQKALDAGVPHISAYALTVEPRTALEKLIHKGKIPHINEEQTYEQFFLLKNILEEKNFIHYELSNFGKEGYFSKNNTAYWEQKPYMGIGPSAHSYNGKERSWNISHNIKYIQAISANIRPCETEKLSIYDSYNELILTGLRTQKGISLVQIESLFGKEFHSHLLREANNYLQEELLLIDNKHLKTTNKGIFLSDGIASNLFIMPD